MLRIVQILVMLFFTSCVYREEPFTTGTYVIKAKETIQISQLHLSITNTGCGRAWVGESEKPYCGLDIRHRDSLYHTGESFRPFYIGTIRIQIDKMNPWGVMEDSVPPGGCRIIVTKLDDITR